MGGELGATSLGLNYQVMIKKKKNISVLILLFILFFYNTIYAHSIEPVIFSWSLLFVIVSIISLFIKRSIGRAVFELNNLKSFLFFFAVSVYELIIYSVTTYISLIIIWAPYKSIEQFLLIFIASIVLFLFVVYPNYLLLKPSVSKKNLTIKLMVLIYSIISPMINLFVSLLLFLLQ